MANMEDCILEYINRQDGHAQECLNTVYDAIHDTIPDAAEKISYGMPTFWKGRNIIQFAQMKQHIGIHPGGEATEVFANRLTEYKTSKGAIQIPNDKELPLDLIKDIT